MSIPKINTTPSTIKTYPAQCIYSTEDEGFCTNQMKEGINKNKLIFFTLNLKIVLNVLLHFQKVFDNIFIFSHLY